MGTVRCNRNQLFIFNLLIFLQSLLLIIPAIPTQQRSRDDSSWGKTNISERVFQCCFDVICKTWYHHSTASALREKCQNMKLFLACIFLHSDWIWSNYPYSVRIHKYGPEKTAYLDTFHAVVNLLITLTIFNLFRTSLLSVLQINCLVTIIILLTTRNDKTWLQHTRT